jgi:hypothetical protein
MKKLATWMLAMGLLAAGVQAQEKPAVEKHEEKSEAPKPSLGHVQRVITLNNPDLAPAIADVLSAFPVQLRWNKDIGVIVLSGQPSGVEAAAEAVRRLDVAPDKRQATRLRSMDFTAHLLIARQDAVKGTLPSELSPVVEQLKGLFQYGGYELLDTMMLRTSERGGDNWLDGSVQKTPPGFRKKYGYRLQLTNPMVAGDDDKGRTIRIARLSLALEVWSTTESTNNTHHWKNEMST